MSTLGKNQTNQNALEAKPCPEKTISEIDEILQHFDVVPSGVEKHIVRYAYRYFLGTALLYALMRIVSGLLSDLSNILGSLVIVSIILIAAIGGSLVLWAFNVWREHVPHILRDLFEKERIQAPAGETARQYLEFLEHYRDVLRSPRRYFLIGSLEIFMTIFLLGYILPIYISYNIVQHQALGIAVVAGIVTLFWILLFLEIAYCSGILFWALLISG